MERGLVIAGDSHRVINAEQLDPTLPIDDPTALVSPDALAYILYTSGSTGQPKGVMQSHRNVLHHIRCYTNSLRITTSDKLTLLSAYGFDAAVMDIFGALLNGATLCPLNARDNELSELRSLIRRDEITIYHSTPTVYRHLLSGLGEFWKPSKLRLVVLGGEEVQQRDVELFTKHLPDAVRHGQRLWTD